MVRRGLSLRHLFQENKPVPGGFQMRNRIIGIIGVVVIVLVVAGLLRMTGMSVDSQTAGPSPKTPWGEPDLQGIWTDPYQTPLQRPAKFANKEFFTDEERAELDAQRAGIPRRDARVERGTERDVAGAYNAVFQSVRPTGKRTSLIVDPPDGKIPPLTPETTKRNQAEREYRLALLQATVTCKNKDAACGGGKYGPPSPRRAEMPPFYNTGRTNRNDGPEDRANSERCMAAVLPDFGGFRRIVQSPGTVSILYDTGQGQGWQRVIPITQNPHLPSSMRQRFGDSRGHWEGNTLVVDVTNFSPKFSFLDARENLHIVERWTRVDSKTIEYAVTIDDPKTWTKPWTVKQELVEQDGQANRIYYEPRCHEGNFGLPTMLLGARIEERAFAKGQGADPATKDTATDFGNEGGTDALTGNAGAIF
jgi:hypothetical protein